MRQAWQHYSELHPIQGIIPVPLHPANERIRGYNQAELLAAELSHFIQKPLLPLLERVKRTPTQVTLNRADRKINMEGAFSLHPMAIAHPKALAGGSFLLIDDVCTTVSTLAECAWVLKRAGVRQVKALVLARDL